MLTLFCVLEKTWKQGKTLEDSSKDKKNMGKKKSKNPLVVVVGEDKEEQQQEKDVHTAESNNNNISTDQQHAAVTSSSEQTGNKEKEEEKEEGDNLKRKETKGQMMQRHKREMKVFFASPFFFSPLSSIRCINYPSLLFPVPSLLFISSCLFLSSGFVGVIWLDLTSILGVEERD